jgi:hypothetical protein
MWVASFDIGKVNFAFYIEEIDCERINQINKLPPAKSRYNQDGTPKPEFADVLNRVCAEGKVILIKNANITEGCDAKLKGSAAYTDPRLLCNMNELLDKYKEYWDKCSAFIVEKQVDYGRMKNPMAIRLGYHCQSYFMFKYGMNKRVIEYDAFNKTHVLGAKKDQKVSKTGKVSFRATSKPNRKKWAIDKAIDILGMRDDMENMAMIVSSKKKDDLSDVIVQLVSWKVIGLLDKDSRYKLNE